MRLSLPDGANGTLRHMHEGAPELVSGIANVERVPCSPEQAEDVLGGGTGGLGEQHARVVGNIWDAVGFLMSDSRYPVELGTILEYNGMIGAHDAEPNAGFIREDHPVRITGCSYKPVPVHMADAERVLADLQARYGCDARGYGLALALTISKRQFCCNGNKRTGIMACNHVLAHADAGLAFAPSGPETAAWYRELLVSFYDDAVDLDEAVLLAGELTW